MRSRIDLGKPFWQWTVLLFLAFVWGSSFILMKKGLASFRDDQVAAYRMFLAFVALLPVTVRNFSILLNGKVLPFVFAGLLGNGIPAFLFARAQTAVDSSFAGILNSLVPLFTLLIGIFFFGIRVRWVATLGVLMGLSGAAALIWTNSNGKIDVKAGYGLYIIAATVCYASAVNIIKKHLQHVKAAAVTSLAFLFVGPPCGVYLFSTDFVSRIGSGNGEVWTSLFYLSVLAVMGTSVGVLVFNYLIKHTSAVFASSVTYMIPVIALSWGVVDGEVVGLVHLAGISVILTGIYLVNYRT